MLVISLLMFFTYTIEHGGGETDMALVTFNVTGVNDPPVAEDDAVAFGENDGNTAVDYTADNGSGADADPDDPLDLTAVNDAAITKGVLTFSLAADTISYNPNGEFESLGTGDTDTTQSFIYTLTDDNAASDTATVSITINGVNDQPVITIIGSNPATHEVSDVTFYVDDEASATDAEDNDATITTAIIAISNVDDQVVGGYSVTYNVQDSESLAAAQQTRTVDVVDTTNPSIGVAEVRVEGNNNNNVNVPFSVTADDTPNPANPNVTCWKTAAGEGSAVVGTGPVSNVYSFNISFSPGITNMTCRSSDLSQSVTDTFDVFVSEMFMDAITTLTPLWEEDTVNFAGTAIGMKAGESIRVHVGDDGSVAAVVTGFSAVDGTANWSASHEFSKDTSSIQQEIKADLFTNPSFANSTTQNLTPAKHVTIVTTAVDADFAAGSKFDHIVNVTSTLLDDSASVGIVGELLNYTDIGVAEDAVQEQQQTTGAGGSTGEVTLQAGPESSSDGDVGDDNIHTEFEEDQFYLHDSTTHHYCRYNNRR